MRVCIGKYLKLKIMGVYILPIAVWYIRRLIMLILMSKIVHFYLLSSCRNLDKIFRTFLLHGNFNLRRSKYTHLGCKYWTLSNKYIWSATYLMTLNSIICFSKFYRILNTWSQRRKTFLKVLKWTLLTSGLPRSTSTMKLEST